MSIRSRGFLTACALVVAASGLAVAAERRIGTLEIKGTPTEQPATPNPFGGSARSSLRELTDALRGAAEKDDIGAVLIRLRDAALPLAHTEELGAAIRSVREKGKRVSVFSEGYDTGALLLGSYADEVIIQNAGPVMLPGLHTEEMYLADMFAWAGLKADMVQVGDFKGANEQMTRNAPSPEWNQNIDQLLDGLYANVRTQLMQGRRLDDARLDQAMKLTWMGDSDDAVKSGLVDTALDLPALNTHLAAKAELESQRSVSLLRRDSEIDLATANPFTLFAQLMKPASREITRETIAVLHINGAIVDGKSTRGFTGESNVGSRTIRNAIEDIRDEDLIKGVVVRIDSPGGSAIASEVIWQGLRRLAEKKPVWISVGNMAASGGYYIASAGSRIYLNPSSIVGSIGVVGGKISMGGLYDHLKVRVHTRSRGPLAGMFDSTSPWSADQVALVRDRMTQTFDLFKDRVRQGRPGIDLSKTAGGWLFTGPRAVELKMADEIGGLHDAITDLAASVSLTEYDVADFPPPPSFADLLEESFGTVGAPVASVLASSRLSGEIAALVRFTVGERVWPQVAQAMNGLEQLRKEPVLLMHPSVLIVR